MTFLADLLARYLPMPCGVAECGKTTEPTLTALPLSTHSVPAVQWSCSNGFEVHWRRMVVVSVPS